MDDPTNSNFPSAQTQIPAPATRRKRTANGGENARWACLLIFIVAVGAALLYVSGEKHDTGTLALLGAVLLVGQICATIPWIIAAKRAGENPATSGAETQATETRLAAKLDECMAKIFANQEIIHNEVHASTESLAKRVEKTVGEIAQKQPGTTDLEIARIAEIVSAKILASAPKTDFPDIDEISAAFANEIKKLGEDLNESLEKFSEELAPENAKIEEQFAAGLKEIDERLDTLALNQENILEKLEALEILPEDSLAEEEEIEENADELAETQEPAESAEEEIPPENDFADDENATVADDDSAFPLPENMLERARAANPTAGTAVEKMISAQNANDSAENVPENVETESENEAAENALAETIAEENEPELENVSEPVPENAPADELPLIEDLPHTVLILKAEFNPGEKPFLRGNAPGLSPKKSVPMEYSGNARWRFDFA